MTPLPRASVTAVASLLALSCGNALAQQHDHSTMSMQDMPGMDMSSTPDSTTAATRQQPAKKGGRPSSTPPAGKPDPHAGHHGMTMPMDHAQHAPAAAKPARPGAPVKAAPKVKPEPANKALAVPASPAGQAMPDGMPMDMDMPDGAVMEHHPSHAHAHAEPAAPAPLPPPTAAELAAAFPDLGDMDMSLHMNDNPTLAVLCAERLEHVDGGTTAWDVRAGIGGNFDKFWLRSEGEQTRGNQAQGNVELQWTHATGPWWDRAVSLRSDFGPGPSRQWAGIGVIGLAPYKFELEAHVYAGEQGRLAARLEAQYEVLLTNRLILTPQVELNGYGKDDAANRIGKGLSQAEAGLRLRYEINRQFAPYVGYAWQHSFGKTADLLRAQDRPELDHGWVAGLRFWF